MANTNETESMDDIRELMLKKKSLEWDITIAKAKIAAYDEKIKETELQLSHEKSQSELVEMLADQSLRTLEALQSNCLSFHSTIAQNEMCISSLMSLCEDNLQCIDTTYTEVESLGTKFGNSIYQNAPWLVEKEQLTAEHDKRCEELGWLHQQNKDMDLKIAARKRQIESHAKLPFKQFCHQIASFKQSAATLKSLLAKERKLNREYNEKLLQNASLTDVLNISEMSDYTSISLNSSAINLLSSLRGSLNDMLSTELPRTTQLPGLDLSEYFPTR
ncbi:hypothetical protein DdX_16463 [Ditylenchus destructor]|uniref:Uncharacterized protein n=1 Tax=Ditylenchus destructor TaxID=166010 RepID=A0AAD4QU10_9BILA|nr:hypothetical protein DdX_16463 [Ditylenchus destructor]